MSSTIEVVVPAYQSETFNTAVYRFLEIQGGAQGDDLLMLRSEPLGQIERKEVTLWSEAAASAFAAFWPAIPRAPTAPPPSDARPGDPEARPSGRSVPGPKG